MMPGDNQSKMVAIAADATVKNCQNCSVLHQNLNEYVSSFLALKQKLTINDDTLRLQQQVKEQQSRLESLEKRTADYDTLQTELQEKRDALKVYEHMSQEMEVMKKINTEVNSENEKLKNEIKNVKEYVESRTLENAKLSREKAEVENDLLNAQASLKKIQVQRDKVEQLIKENAESMSMKENLEIKVKHLEEFVSKQNHRICELSHEKNILETNIDDLQERILKLERERCKDYKSACTQVSVPEEPKVDKEKFRLLLNNLWACVDPGQSIDNVSECSQENSPLSLKSTTNSSPKRPLHSFQSPKKNKYIKLKSSPYFHGVSNDQEYQQGLNSRPTTSKACNKLPKNHKTEEQNSSEMSLEQIREMFKPLIPCLSPLPETVTSAVSTAVTDEEDSDVFHQTFPPVCQDMSKIKSTLSFDKCPSHASKMDLSKDVTQEHVTSINKDDNIQVEIKSSQCKNEILESLTLSLPCPNKLEADLESNIPDMEVPICNNNQENTVDIEQTEMQGMIDVSQTFHNEELPTKPSATSIEKDMEAKENINSISAPAGCSSRMEVDDQDTATSLNNDMDIPDSTDSTVPVEQQSCEKPQRNIENESVENQTANVLILEDGEMMCQTNVKIPPKVLNQSVNDSPGNPGSSNASAQTPQTQDSDLKEVKSEKPCEQTSSVVQESKPLDSQSLRTSHSLLQQLAPSCFQPTSKVQTVKNESKSAKTEYQTVPDETATLTLSNADGHDEKVSIKKDKSIIKIISMEPSHGTKKVGSSAPQEFIGQVRSEMGPPLPPLLTPVCTPPKGDNKCLVRKAVEKLSFPSPGNTSKPNTPVNDCVTPSDDITPCLDSPLHQSGVLSSPLQFGSATPKHALPVPGRLPSTAMSSSPSTSCSPSQEHSMRILDTMYPEMSARARTLSILKGNVNLSVCSKDSGTLPTAIEIQSSGFKSINSTSTAFTKAKTRGAKRALNLPQPEDNKVMRLDSPEVTQCPRTQPSPSKNDCITMLEHCTNKSLSPIDGEASASTELKTLFKKIEDKCFDLLPVVQSHLFVGNLPRTPVLRDEEKEVLSVIFNNNRLPPEYLMSAIEKQIKRMQKNLNREKPEVNANYLQALCRVYIGICRQRKCWEKARIFAYNILFMDYPDAPKMILFMITTWPNLLNSGSDFLCKAIHAVTKFKTPPELQDCMSSYLSWDKKPPCSIETIISQTLSKIRSGSTLSFVKHDRYGIDLGPETWQHIFTVQLLCASKEWKWTYENLLSKDLWPLMNTWVTQPRDQQTPVSDVTVATVLRLVGRLGQLGIKQKCVSSVMTVANVINTFGRQGHSEGVPWEVQLAAVYCIVDLSPCDPKSALEALSGWREETSQTVPPCFTNYINQIGSIRRRVKS